MKSSWKTSLAGVASILTGLLALVHAGQGGTITTSDITVALTAITTGVGLLFARDNNVNSEMVGVAPAQLVAAQAVHDAAAAATPPPTPPTTPKTP